MPVEADMRRRTKITRERLDGTVIDIEFLLIAVIQGLALTTLAVESEEVIREGQWLYWPYMIAGFVLILNFWSLAIVHSISFISWPFDLVHTLLYFVVAFVEVSAFAEITHPDEWFILTSIFFLVSWLLYAWDMKMIRDRRADFEDSPARQRLYDDIYRQQALGVRVLLPPTLIIHAVVVGLILFAPQAILGGNRHEYAVGLQLVTGLIYLGMIIRDYGARQKLISACIEEDDAGLA
jgi:hypothetical protein